MTRRRRRHRRTAAAAAEEEVIRARSRSRSLPLFFSPNAVLYESCGMAPTDGASWVATYARRGYQVVVFNGRGVDVTRGTPAPATQKLMRDPVAMYLLERCRVPMFTPPRSSVARGVRHRGHVDIVDAAPRGVDCRRTFAA